MIIPPETLQYVVYALAAASAILVVEVLYLQYVQRRNKRAINRRLRVSAESDGHPQEGLKQLLQERGLTESGDYVLGLIWLNRLYAQSGIRGSPVAYLARFAIAGVVIAGVLRLLGASLPAVLIVFLVIVLLLPLWWLRRSRTRRLRTFERQLPDALDMMVRSLRAGHPMSVAVGLVGRELSDPIGTEFGIVFDEVSFGAQLETAIARMAERVGFEGLQLLSVALSIQSKTGGNLTEILGNLARLVRERLKLFARIRVLSSEGRLSAWVLGLMPFALAGLMNIFNPGFMNVMWRDPIGIVMTQYLMVMMAVGIVILVKIVRIRV